MGVPVWQCVLYWTWQISRSSSTLNTSALIEALPVSEKRQSGANFVCPARISNGQKCAFRQVPWSKKRGNNLYLCSQHCQGKCMHVWSMGNQLSPFPDIVNEYYCVVSVLWTYCFIKCPDEIAVLTSWSTNLKMSWDTFCIGSTYGVPGCSVLPQCGINLLCWKSADSTNVKVWLVTVSLVTVSCDGFCSLDSLLISSHSFLHFLTIWL